MGLGFKGLRMSGRGVKLGNRASKRTKERQQAHTGTYAQGGLSFVKMQKTTVSATTR